MRVTRDALGIGSQRALARTLLAVLPMYPGIAQAQTSPARPSSSPQSPPSTANEPQDCHCHQGFAAVAAGPAATRPPRHRRTSRPPTSGWRHGQGLLNSFAFSRLYPSAAAGRRPCGEARGREGVRQGRATGTSVEPERHRHLCRVLDDRWRADRHRANGVSGPAAGRNFRDAPPGPDQLTSSFGPGDVEAGRRRYDADQAQLPQRRRHARRRAQHQARPYRDFHRDEPRAIASSHARFQRQQSADPVGYRPGAGTLGRHEDRSPTVDHACAGDRHILTSARTSIRTDCSSTDTTVSGSETFLDILSGTH